MANFKKFLISGLSIMLVLSFLFILTGCPGPDEGEVNLKEVGNEKKEVLKTSNDMAQINGNDVIYVVNPARTKSLTGRSRLAAEETAMLVSLQGLVAQTKAEIYIGKPEDTLLQYIADNYGKTIEVIDDMSALIDKYKDHINDMGYIKVKYSTTSVATSMVNQATTLAAANKWVLVPCKLNEDDALEKAVIEKGFNLKKNYFLVDGNETESKIIEENKDKLNTKVLAALSPTFYNSRDYGIATKSPFFFYRATTTTKDELKKVYGMLNPLAGVVGWQDVKFKPDPTAQENQYGALHSQWADATADHGVVAIPVSDIHNLSLYASIKQEGNLEQKATKSNAGENVHYATIIYNNGEDMGEFLNFIEDTNMFAYEDKSQNPVGWTINASLYDYIPMAMRYAYENMTDNEYFVASTAGLGRVNVGLLEEHGHPYGTTLQAYLDRTNDLLGKTGLPYISYLGRLDDKTAKDRKSVIELFGNLSNVKGGFILSDTGVSPTGGIKWVGDKPFVADREIIRAFEKGSREQQDAMREVRSNNRIVNPTINKIATQTAERLAQYEVNPASIEGYSVVQVYSEYHYKNLIKNFYEKLDTNRVRIVTPDEFIKLIQQNITDKKDVSSVKVLSTVKNEEQ